MQLRELRVWQEATALAAEVVKASLSTRREVDALVAHTIMTATSVAEKIALGYARHAPGEQRQLYRAAIQDLGRLETSLAILRQAALLSAAQQSSMVARIATVRRLLSAFLVYLERQLGATS